jgi:2-oxoglutarate ferredoxin oxidoreductase subunit gamma
MFDKTHPQVILALKEEVIIAGFGGQGVLLIGKILAYSGMIEGNHVTWLPSYGPEMRGGTANCTVILSDRSIGSPYVVEPSSIIVLNRPSLDRFESMVKPEGVILINSSMVNREVARLDVRVGKVAASEIAEGLGTSRVTNMVALGAYAKVRTVVSMKSLLTALGQIIPERHKDLMALNRNALRTGFDSLSDDIGGNKRS